jgi:hypothetical protein
MVGVTGSIRGDPWGHEKDIVANRWPDTGLYPLLVEATIEPGVTVARHTHPGIESAYVLEGGFELPIQDQATRMIKATASKFRPKRRMRVASRVTPNPEFSSPTL